MDAAAVKDLVSSVGFPIAVAIFVLWRLEGSMKDLVGAVTKLTATVSIMCDRLDSVLDRRAP